MKKIDLAKEYKDLYTATAKIKEVNVGAGWFLCVDGCGAPGGAAFQKAIGELFGAIYTAKFMLKAEGKVDFKVARLECLWDVADPEQQPMETLKWRMMIRAPEALTAAHLNRAKKAMKAKGVDASAVKRAKIKEGRCLQTLHVGPYKQIGITYRYLASAALENGLIVGDQGHEIYLNDPQRTASERLRTIVRFRVRKLKKA